MNSYIQLEPISLEGVSDKQINFHVHAAFEDDIDFYRGNFRVNTSHYFRVQSCNCPELNMDNGVMYIPGDDDRRDSTVLKTAIKNFPFLNTQIKIADELIKSSLFDTTMGPYPEEEDYPDEDDF